MMTDDEILAVVQAHKDGKKIQKRVGPGTMDGYTYEEWISELNPRWDFDRHDYRAAPEPRKPREWWAELPDDGSVGQIFTNSRQLTKGGYLVRVREVIE